MRSPRQVLHANLVMWAIVALVAFGGACKKKGGPRPDEPRWTGIPEVRSCDWDDDTATCISEGKVYTCVRDDQQGCEGDSRHSPVNCAPRQ